TGPSSASAAAAPPRSVFISKLVERERLRMNVVVRRRALVAAVAIGVGIAAVHLALRRAEAFPDLLHGGLAGTFELPPLPADRAPRVVLASSPHHREALAVSEIALLHLLDDDGPCRKGLAARRRAAVEVFRAWTVEVHHPVTRGILHREGFPAAKVL